jgi:hypothetical protein
MFATRFKRMAAVPFALLALATLMNPAYADKDTDNKKSAHIKVLAPEEDYVAGIGSRAFLVDLAIEFKGDLVSTGVSPELTGPGPLANAGPFPGTFGFGANLDHFPGLVVLLSSTTSGPGRNLANLFNITTVTNQEPGLTEVWTTWIVGAPNAFGLVGQNTPSRLFVAVVEGDAPDVVVDMDGNGVIDKKDLKLMNYKVISNTPKVDFFVNGF